MRTRLGVGVSWNKCWGFVTWTKPHWVSNMRIIRLFDQVSYFLVLFLFIRSSSFGRKCSLANLRKPNRKLWGDNVLNSCFKSCVSQSKTFKSLRSFQGLLRYMLDPSNVQRRIFWNVPEQNFQKDTAWISLRRNDALLFDPGRKIQGGSK